MITHIIYLLVSKYDQEGSVTAEVDAYIKQKQKLDDMNSKINKMILKMKNFLIENDDFLTTIRQVKFLFSIKKFFFE